MAGGVSTALLKAAANAIVVLIVAAFIISAVFVEQGQQQLKATAMSMLQQRIRALKMKGVQITPQLLNKINMTIYRDLGLLEPVWLRILRFTFWSITFNFQMFPAKVHYAGASGDTAKDVVLAALPNTVMLFTTATVICIFIGIFLGLQAARKAGGLADRAISTVAMVTTSLPMWWVGMLMLLVFSFELGIAPAVCINVYGDLAQLARHVHGILYYIYSIPIWLHYMWLPVLTIVLVSFGGWAYTIRNVVISVMTEDFVNVARAKGLPERTVLYKHVLRTASPPIVTMSALSLVASLGGAIITETVFSWPGMGRTYWVALQAGDTGVLIALTYVTVFLFVVIITFLDFIYALLDPRVRTGLAGGGR